MTYDDYNILISALNKASIETKKVNEDFSILYDSLRVLNLLLVTESLEAKPDFDKPVINSGREMVRTMSEVYLSSRFRLEFERTNEFGELLNPEQN